MNFKLVISYLIIKSLNRIFRFIEKIGPLSLIIIFLSIVFLNSKSSWVNILLYLNLAIALIYVSIKLTTRVNNVLCIDNITKQINMSILIDINKLKKSKNKLSRLNSIVDDFLYGLCEVAKNPKKYGIKDGQVYHFRTHGAIYVLFKRKFEKSKVNFITYSKGSISKVMENTKHKQQSVKKLSWKDKIIFITERILLVKNFKEFMQQISNFENLNSLQVCEFKAIFNTKENKLYIYTEEIEKKLR